MLWLIHDKIYIFVCKGTILMRTTFIIITVWQYRFYCVICRFYLSFNDRRVHKIHRRWTATITNIWYAESENAFCITGFCEGNHSSPLDSPQYGPIMLLSWPNHWRKIQVVGELRRNNAHMASLECAISDVAIHCYCGCTIHHVTGLG